MKTASIILAALAAIANSDPATAGDKIQHHGFASGADPLDEISTAMPELGSPDAGCTFFSEPPWERVTYGDSWHVKVQPTASYAIYPVTFSRRLPKLGDAWNDSIVAVRCDGDDNVICTAELYEDEQFKGLHYSIDVQRQYVRLDQPAADAKSSDRTFEKTASSLIVECVVSDS